MIDLLSEDEFLHRAANVPLQTLQWELARRRGVEVLVRRDDLVDANLSGNKFYKLFYNLQQAKSLGHRRLLSFGGAYSNHLYALAAAGRDFGFGTLGVIRGERPMRLSPMLQDAERWGMQLHFVSRSDYKENKGSSQEDQGKDSYCSAGASEFWQGLHRCYGDFYRIPEGGANALGFQGTQVIGWALQQQMEGDCSYVCLACGTGSTMAGVAAGIATHAGGVGSSANVLGFSVLKGEGDMAAAIIDLHQSLALEVNNWRLISGYHGGGYGKKLPRAMAGFREDFERETRLDLDPVYTAKMCWGVAQLLAQGYWPRGSRVVLVHTGGLQGRRGL